MKRQALIREALALALAGVVVLLLLSLYSFSPQDPSFNHATNAAPQNLAGSVGAYTADFLYQLFGYAAWGVVVLLALLAVRVAMSRQSWLGGWTSLLWLPVILGVAALLHAHGSTWFEGMPDKLPAGTGGALGKLLASGLSVPLHAIGRDILLIALILSSFVAASHISLLNLMQRMTVLLAASWAAIRRATAVLRAGLASRKDRLQAQEQRRQGQQKKVRRELKSTPEIAKAEQLRPSRRARQERQVELALSEPGMSGFKLPSLSLFGPGQDKLSERSPESLQAMARMLEKKMLDYRIEGEVVAVQPGPVVTQFEFEPAPGTKASRIAALQDDLARAMSAVSVRVAGNIPGKSVIGIEIPNDERTTVLMKEVLASKAFTDGKHVLPLALGVDIAGKPVVTDLAKMPHLLIAGTTGSGKSVSVNSMVCSLLMTYSPQDLRLIMVDPKMLELSMYEDIPHLLVPVVTNPHKAAKALAWTVFEMERRYQLMAEAKARNIEGFNRSLGRQTDDGTERLPYIVIVIDELADLMMVAGREVEQSICRLAQKARAAGIHLILATQRPSVDVITGLIKANLPSRISFQVSSRVDSRTILDQMGAEQLLGHGDMLFISGGRDIKRVHGAYVSEVEVASLVDHLRSQGMPDYREEVFEAPAGEGETGSGEDDYDPRYDEAVELVIDKGQCSVSMVQRHLRVGYNRASRMVERMELEGLVTPPGSGGMRKVLAKKSGESGGVDV